MVSNGGCSLNLVNRFDLIFFLTNFTAGQRRGGTKTTDNRAVVTDEAGWVNNRPEVEGRGNKTSLDTKRIRETEEAEQNRRKQGLVTCETKVEGHRNVRAKENRILNWKEMGKEVKEWRGDFLRVLHSGVRRSQLNPQMLFMQEDPDSDLVSGRGGHLSQRPSVISLTFPQSTYDPHCLFPSSAIHYSSAPVPDMPMVRCLHGRGPRLLIVKNTFRLKYQKIPQR